MEGRKRGGGSARKGRSLGELQQSAEREVRTKVRKLLKEGSDPEVLEGKRREWETEAFLRLMGDGGV
eukprot:10788356-Alexandrium_andersonii.AAC.1